MKKLTFVCMSIFFSLNVSQLRAANISFCDGTTNNPCIVQDTVMNSSSVKNYRDSKSILNAMQMQKGNTIGLDKLNLSGSGAPSGAGFKEIVSDIKRASRNKAKNIIDVDLRQESHGYLNDNAITLTTENDWVNKGKAREEILDNESRWLDNLGQQQMIENVLSPAQFKKHFFQAGKTYLVKKVSDEKDAATAAHMQYFRLTVTDHMAPDNIDVDRFVDLVKKVKPDTWIHVHCRGGDGRTTTFMVMYDMLRNADKASLDDIVKRQAAVIPHYNVMETVRKNPEMTELYEKRAEFIKKFYVFAQEYLKDSSLVWSEWNKSH